MSSFPVACCNAAALGLVLLTAQAGYGQDLYKNDLRVKSWTVSRGIGPDNQGLGGRLDWSATRNLIAYDEIGSDGFYNLWTMNPDGSNPTCITCGTTPLGHYNIGSPRWSPDGKWIALVVQRGPLKDNNNGRPGVGAGCDFWIMDFDNKVYTKIADTSTYSDGGGVLHPVFSHKGDKLFWVERIGQTQLAGNWQMKLADFNNGTISNVRIPALTPTPNSRVSLYESHNFTLDDTQVTFSGNLEGQPAFPGIDVYIMDVNPPYNWTNLTKTPSVWDEHLHPIPGTNKLIWMTGTQTYGDTPTDLHTEFWMMDLNGNNKRKLTWFNDVRSTPITSSTSRVSWYAQFHGGVVADLSFGPVGADGLPTQVMVYLILNGKNLGNTGVNLLLNLEKASTSVNAASYFRPPLAPNSYLTIGSADGNLGPTPAAVAVPPYPTVQGLGGTTVTITDATGQSLPAPLVYTSANQINLLIPDGTQPGPADVTVTNSSGVVTHDTFTIEETSPALFSANSSGAGTPAAIVQKAGVDSYVVASCTLGAQVNQCIDVPIDVSGATTYLNLYGTGLRQGKVFTSQLQSGSSIETLAAPTYAGAQGDFPGLDQIQLILPASLAGSNRQYVLMLTVDGVAANPVTITIR